MEQKAYLVLENGQVFEGRRFGASGDVTGELVFTTSMTGYLETLTDPSYCGQIVMQTFPLIGNYGVIPSDFESSNPILSAYIVREWCQEPSNFRNEGTLDTFLKAHRIIGLYGVDTRELTKIIREQGVMNARILSDPRADDEMLSALRTYRVTEAVERASCKEPSIVGSEGAKRRVVLWDFGAKQNISRELAHRGCEVVRVPADFTAEQILSYQPDGIMLSNGPGDPADNIGVIEELKKLCVSNLTIFGICLGHQLLALAQGAKTTKLKYGHRGANQPVMDRRTGRLYMSSQNHGYAVESETLPSWATERFVNANDNTCEGVDYHNMPAFSVQFHPEACGGPHDTGFLFDQFIAMMEEKH